jgi:hypothetical protein
LLWFKDDRLPCGIWLGFGTNRPHQNDYQQGGVSHPGSNEPFAIVQSASQARTQSTPLDPPTPEFYKKILKVSIPWFLEPLKSDEFLDLCFWLAHE